MRYVVRFTDGARLFELSPTSLESAQEMVEALKKANAADVTVIAQTSDGMPVGGAQISN